MDARKHIGRFLAVAVALALSGPIIAVQQRSQTDRPLADFDIRAGRAPAAITAPALAELQRAAAAARGRRVRVHPHTGAIRLVEAPGLRVGGRDADAVRGALASAANRLGLERGDLDSLQTVRDYTSASTGLRHLIFRQLLDGIPVFDAAVAAHVNADGEIVRLTSSAARRSSRAAVPVLSADQAAARAAEEARGPGRVTPAPTLTWFPMDGDLVLAWHVSVDLQDGLQFYDVIIDAAAGDLLLRRNRVLFAEGTGRVIQSASTQLLDPRQPDPMPSSATTCPPPMNHELRSLTGPFRDATTVLSDTGHLEGNNTQVLRKDLSTPSAAGSFDGSSWAFDFAFNTAGAAETSLFFAVNFAHDFFYDLGFDEASGNFQANNFGRGGLGNDRIRAIARSSAGRNNATFQPAPEGSSPIISMFLWDATGCWGADVDGDGSIDLDGDYDFDIIIHEFHHGVSHRLNTSFTGAEADAIGEGGGDFFAYSLNGDTTLAEYSHPGGIRGVNAKTYGAWFCFFGFFCEPHANGEIFANVMWDVRERFRADFVNGSEASAINEVHQLYVDALKLSPPAPTMLDMRDAMLQADGLRNPGTPHSVNYCRIWEEFAGRGMGVNASDTADSGGANQVEPDSSVPAGCDAPPPPPTVTLTVAAATATEAGTTPGMFTISRGVAAPSSLAVGLTITGTAARGSDYVDTGTSATIPAGAASVNVLITPIDDANVEGNETVNFTVQTSTSYVVGSPASGTVTIVSDDTAPDLVISSVVAPTTGGAGLDIEVTDVTKNQGTGSSPVSVTSFYLSSNSSWDTGDTLLGTRDVPVLAPGATDAGSTTLTVPADKTAGSYYVIAKADGPQAVTESNESNNTRPDLIRIGPDLLISTLSAPTAAGQGAAISVTETTKNNGSGGAAESVTRFFLSDNTSLGTGDTPLGQRSVGPLDPGASNMATTTLTIPGTLPSGAYYLIAAADNDNDVAETSDANNTRYFLIRIGPDLQVSSLSAPTRVVAGSTIAVTDTTKNAGQAPAGPSTTAFYLSLNTTVGAGDIRLTETRSVAALAAGAVSTGTTNVTLSGVGAGQWYLVAVADDANVLAETFEVNNQRALLLHFGPDLDVTSLSAPSTAIAGTALSISSTVKNLGAETAPASITRFYLSANTAFDGSDTFLGERAVPALAQNASNASSTTVTLPLGKTGKLYIIAVADGAGAIGESSESNNVQARVITINP